MENRCNGRIIQRGLFRPIWNGRVHPSRNHFLAQVELWTQEGSPLPATKTTKAGFRDGAPPGWRPSSPGSHLTVRSQNGVTGMIKERRGL